MNTRSIVGMLLVAIVGGVVGYNFPHPGTKATPGAGGATDANAHWASGSKTIAYVLPNDGPYYDLKWKGASAELIKLGYQPQRYSAGGYKNIKAQIDIMQNLIQKHVGGIILHSVDQEALKPSVELAFAKGIPVVAENVEIKSSELAGSVQLENYQNGYELAMTLVDAIGGKGKIAALVGPPGLEASDEMWRGAKDYLRLWPNVQVVREEYLQPNTPEALDRAQAILSSHRDLAGFYTWFVQNGIGAAQAVRAAGYKPGQIPIVAKDASPQGEDLMHAGYLTALLVGEPIRMGATSADLIDRALRGQSGPRAIILHNALMTDRTAKLIDRSGFEVAARDSSR